jgi:tetratricopeptide (TPR) repeat protein
VFDGKQIKSAVGNTGAFDGTKPDIRYSQSTPAPNAYASPGTLSAAIRATLGNRVADWIDRNAVITDSAGLTRILGQDAHGAKGAAHNGKLYLVYDQLNPANLRGTVLHEAVHFALNRHIGDTAFQKVLREISRMNDLGQPQEAIKQLQALLRELPRSEDVLLALANYSAELGQRDQARTYARTLTEIAPGNQAYRQLLLQLQ